jgi:hypothetical protein
MGSVADAFRTAFRDFVTPGLPSSGANEPVKSEVRAIGAAIEGAIATMSLGSMLSVVKETKALLDADLAHGNGTVGLVYADATDANNDIYVKSGASGTGSWVLTTVLHDALAGLAIPIGEQVTEVRAEGNTVFTPLSRAENVEEENFRTYYDRFYGLEIIVPPGMNGGASPRLFVTRIGVKSSAPADADNPGITISQLKTDNTFEAVAECYDFSGEPTYYDGLAFVDGVIVGIGDYAGSITGKIRMERATAWDYFYAGGVNETQIARVFSDTSPGTGSLEIDPAFIRIVDRASGQPAYSVFSATAYQQKAGDTVFRNHIDTLFDMKIELATALDALPYKRLYVTAISSEVVPVDTSIPVVEFSYLNEDDEFVLVARGRTAAVGVNDHHYDPGTQFVEFDIVPAAGYEGLISGRFKWLRAAGWDYFFNAGTPITWSNDTPGLGSLELSQDVITYVGETRILPERPSYPGFLNRIPAFADAWLKGEADVTLVALGDSILATNNYTSDRVDASTRPPLCHEYSLFSYVEEKLRWRGQEYRRFDVDGVFTESATTRETKDYDAAWDWQAGTDLVPTSSANFRPAITRVLTGTNASVAYSFPAGMRRCDFIYRTDYLCAATTGVTIAGGDGKVQVWDEDTSAWVEANGYSFSAQEADLETEYDIADPYGDSPDQPLRKSIYQKRIKMRSLTDLTAKTVTIANSGTGRLNYWGIEFSPRATMFRIINSARGGHNISRLRAFEAWDVDYWEPDLIWLNSMIINEGARSITNMPATNTPAAFAGRFTAYVEALQAKAYAPEVMATTMFIGEGAEIVDETTGKFNVGTVIGYGSADVFNYVGNLDRAYEALDVPHINMFYTFLDIAERLAAAAGTGNIWTSAIAGSGETGGTLTDDGTHQNDYGSLVGATLLLPAFDRLI